MGCDQFATIGIRNPESENAGAPSRPRGAAGETVDHDAAMPNDAGASKDGGTSRDAGAASDSGAAHDAGAECAPIQVAECNPVKNEGCSASLMMQCAVDLNATLAGYCIFNSGGPPPALGGACLNTGVTESCPPTSTCVVDKCRKLCLCGTDCEAGQCCKDPVGSTGFKTCGDC
jgi:hypothetical protein